MIIKERKLPLSIQKMQALLRRLPPQHQKVPAIKEQLAKSISGYKGEKKIDYPLTFLPDKNYFILHDIRLKDKDHFFQIDTLILTKKYALIIETKNISGTLYFDPNFNQLIRTKDGEDVAFPDPIIQVMRHELQLKQWFAANKLPSVPIASLVVIGHPQSVIRTSPENLAVFQKVIRPDFFPYKISQIDNSHNETISDKDIKKCIRLLLKQHTPADLLIKNQFKIEESDLIQGVICDQCNYFPLMRIHGQWFCSKCKHKSKDAHLAALKDYYLLLGTNINNRKLREFLRIQSADQATRILRSLNLRVIGKNKGKVYNLEFND